MRRAVLEVTLPGCVSWAPLPDEVTWDRDEGTGRQPQDLEGVGAALQPQGNGVACGGLVITGSAPAGWSGRGQVRFICGQPDGAVSAGGSARTGCVTLSFLLSRRELVGFLVSPPEADQPARGSSDHPADKGQMLNFPSAGTGPEKMPGPDPAPQPLSHHGGRVPGHPWTRGGKCSLGLASEGCVEVSVNH